MHCRRVPENNPAYNGKNASLIRASIPYHFKVYLQIKPFAGFRWLDFRENSPASSEGSLSLSTSDRFSQFPNPIQYELPQNFRIQDNVDQKCREDCKNKTFKPIPLLVGYPEVTKKSTIFYTTTSIASQTVAMKLSARSEVIASRGITHFVPPCLRGCRGLCRTA